ncbi:helix-turn-helix transcriptional regulator [Mycolicibacterium pallens]|uniref:Helix-turn-helix domain-containing protein n=1 Tax=Mycolicibacterium pallens TaxID=370524 RepID=A0ABX8VCW8_9MYCO|nr:helix-turn-helix domain-containing protein [Mycolicibacterium pallens]QYL14928.1 helix-turn-helix domain-containing protein [Mycolicibacterium pallens]
MTELIGIEETARMCNQAISTLRWWKAQGVGPKAAKIGRRVMYRKQDVEDWINAQFANA